MAPKVSVLIGSSRPGGLDVVFAGLAAQTFSDFEIVFADRLYAQRHAEVLDLVSTLGINQPVYHVPNHRNDTIWRTTCAGFNTEFMLAAGEVGIMHMDFAYAPPGWIEAHLAYGGKFVLAPIAEYAPPEFDYDGNTPLMNFSSGSHSVEDIDRQFSKFSGKVSIFKESFGLSMFRNLVGQAPVKAHFNYMNTKNCSFPIETVLDINGIDENADRGGGPGDTDLGRRLCGAGLEVRVANDAVLKAFHVRPVLPTPLLAFTHAQQPKQLGRWSGAQGDAYFRQRGDSLRANNLYDLRVKRETIWHWRDLSQRREPVIPVSVVEDVDYWPNFPWIPS